MSDRRVEQALQGFEATANNFAFRVIRMADVRSEYAKRIREMSDALRKAVDAGELSARRGAELANQWRNEIMQIQRGRDRDLGRALAQNLKKHGVDLEKAIARAMTKLGVEDIPFEQLAGAKQQQVYLRVIESSGNSRPSVTAAIPRLRWAARGLWLGTIAIAAYNIGTSEHPWWQSGRETAVLSGGLVGSFLVGAALGAQEGVWGGPWGVAAGILVGGILGTLLADHGYVEAVGTGDPLTRSFIARFSSFWAGVDEEGMAVSLVTEHRGNPEFIARVIASLNESHYTDADDVALALVEIARRDAGFLNTLRGAPVLRKVLLDALSEGMYTGSERAAVQLLVAP